MMSALKQQTATPSDIRLRDKLQLDKATKGASPASLQILGHRGAIYEAVENTLEAFQSCLELDGCHGVELDVFLLKDGSLVVFHGTGGDVNPGLLDQYCESMEGAESVLDLTLAETQALKFVQQSDHLVAPHQTTSTARIPTLQEVLELFRKYPEKRLAIELKGPGTVKPTAKMVQDMGMEKQVTFSSFDHARVKQVAEKDPSLRTAALFKGQVPEEFLELAQQAQADEIHLRYDTCSVDRVQAAHEKGFLVMAWFRGPKAMQVDMKGVYADIKKETDVYEMILRTGVDGIICNRPHSALKMMRSEREKKSDFLDKIQSSKPLEGPSEPAPEPTRMPIAVSAN